ncbi:MAG: hypothetical protein ABIZ91_09585 [Gemmatimonadaceae bacterium]
MSPPWKSPLGRTSPRAAAVLAEVLDSLQGQLAESPPPELENDSEITELISAAMAELHRVAPIMRQDGGIAPVLGTGVLQELLRRKRCTPEQLEPEPVRTVDERL